MNLVIIGYRGTGKSTISDWLHLELRMDVCHMDERLEERFGERISSYVAQHGWDSFREEECILVEELAEMDNIIIDTGGGVVERVENLKMLKRNGFIVWLHAEPEYITRYIKNDPNRPPLTQKKETSEEVEEVLARRIPLYEQAADYIVRTDQHTLEESGALIYDIWKQQTQSVRR